MYSYSGLAMMAGFGALLVFLAFVAAIVVTVLLYKKYLSTGKDVAHAGLKRDWGPFLRFETLVVEKVMQVLYLFLACLIAFECVAAAISSLAMAMYDPGAVLSGIIGAVILCVVLEVLNRIGFEFAMITILIWKNTSVIRKTVAGDEPSATPFAQAPVSTSGAPFVSGEAPQQPASHSASASSSFGAAPQPVQQPQPAQPAQPVVASPAQPTAPAVPVAADGAWTCPTCGTENKMGSFCAQCGTKRG